jgi:hypothetical protein
VSDVSQGQLLIDFDYDERVASFAREVAIMLAPHGAPGTKAEATKVLADRIARLACKRWKDAHEPREEVRCHTCDEQTTIGNRVRVAVCNRCALTGRSVGAAG